MDEELRKYLDGMMAQINGQHERILNRLASIEGGALLSGGRWLDLEARVTKLEDDKA